jgi:hypothetical protein
MFQLFEGFGLANEIAVSEILDWWSVERGRVRSECIEFEKRMHTQADKAISDLTAKELTLPMSPRRKAIVSELDKRIQSFGTAIADRLATSAKSSIQLTEGSLELRNQATDYAELAVGGAAAVGAVSLAASATTLATGTATSFFIFTQPQISIPILMLAGAGAAAMALISPSSFVVWQVRMRKRYSRKLCASLSNTILQESDGGSPGSLCTHFFQQLDDIKDKRLEALL